ncbi:MAG: hypothetical protein KKA76_11455, partial [Proteobacteria bacterium]|nr:hypothetical protein [Pseudomonadota bacterium]
KSYEGTESYSETILLFVLIATVESRYQVDEYACRVDAETVQKIMALNAMLEESNIHVANAGQKSRSSPIKRYWKNSRLRQML